MDMIEVKILHSYDQKGPGGSMRDIGPWLISRGLTNDNDWEFDFLHENDQTYYLIKIQPKFKEVATILALKWA